ncbi:G-type lectin S-receptor-like serine/threonine-protein kinase isoform X1 [Tanacetum coccineum]|uniref:G-type lectin S-receptor-like serine/threonine-protein kinase isoform X1 n=1 Tax=Tanacetum coccineum TaxID=301880 RepID=A0ABQ4YEY5_9ASTR
MIWSSNSTTTKDVPVAQLLDTGDLVIRNVNDRDPEKYLWQSFDYPGNTFLPDMKFGLDFVKGLNKYLTSWKSADDPSSGEYTNKMESEGYPQILLRKGSEVMFNSGPWNGRRFSGMPNLKPNDIYTFGFEINQKEFYYKYELVSNSVVSRMILNTDGVIQRFIWVERAQEWVIYVTGQMDNCYSYGLCGPYGNSDLNCAGGDGFVKQRGVKVPDTRKTWFNVSMNLEECEKVCLRNCNCTAYANSDVRSGGSGCLIWLDALVDIRMYGEDGQDIYVRMAASELRKQIGKLKAREEVNTNIHSVVVGMTLILGLGLCYRRRKHKKNGNADVIFRTPAFSNMRVTKVVVLYSTGKLVEDGKSIAADAASQKARKQGLDDDLPLVSLNTLPLYLYYCGIHPLTIAQAWRLYKNGNHLELIDGTLKSSYVQSEVARAIHIGLLCVQKYPEDRPSMPMVVLMLGSEIPLPEPKQPGFYTDRRRPQEAESSSSHFEWSSSNRLSVTYLQPR